ncbi:hypothetical protein CTAYLR_008842 [Chrysophaeum taylorii]|uniref:Mannosyltransferase n=1 Tax=Chrysophaeum taylorii TaxID=2483200 RepID=A0AAD7U6U7_9STRA|nr:hypothetical protein CTAYLR_008842 [Chrysophaeum taylorii]
MRYATALCLLGVVRVVGAFLNGVSDCDEVFNYWEAIAFGLQTWEWAPEFALRSFAFVAPFRLVNSFHGIRVVLGLSSAAAEAALVTASPNPRTLLALLASSPGMWTSSTALLPSSVATTLAFCSHACWIRGNRLGLAVFAAVVATLWCGWPFVAVVFLPFFADSMVGRPRDSVIFGLLSGLIIIPIAAVDAWFYGGNESPLLNVVRYNSNGGDELYGVAPASFYLKNLLLNVNVAVFGLAHKNAAPAMLWLAVLAARPHKEERFTYPAYASLYDAAARLPLSFLGPPGVLLGAMRVAALTKYYNTPQLAIWRAAGRRAAELGGLSRVCVGAEWHRFTSSFFLPQNAKLEFVKSDFAGQLPRHWGSNGRFNDRNEEEPDRYVDISTCDLYVDLVVDGLDSNWTVVASFPFLDAQNTPTLARAFLIPFYSLKKAKWAQYVLLEPPANSKLS